MRGENGFGYDPVFLPLVGDLIFGEMTRKLSTPFRTAPMLLPSSWPGVLVADASRQNTPGWGLHSLAVLFGDLPYCDFNVHPVRDMQAADWRGDFLALEHAQTMRADGPVETVFGGGTPSLMPPS